MVLNSELAVKAKNKVLNLQKQKNYNEIIFKQKRYCILCILFA